MDTSSKYMFFGFAVFWGALFFIHPSFVYLFLASAGLCGLLIFWPSTVSGIRVWIVSRKWKGYAGATVKEVKGGRERIYYGRWFYRQRQYEYPVISYQVGEETYVQEWSYARRNLGAYSVGEVLPILYNDKDPKEAILQGECSEDDLLGLFLTFVFAPGICIACLVFMISFFMSFLDTHALLYDPETGYGYTLSVSFDRYQTDPLTERPSFADGLEKAVEETVQHFKQIEKMIEGMEGWRHDTYRRRYEKAAAKASRQLAAIYSQSITQLSAQYGPGDGWEGGQETIWQSVYSDFLRQTCPQIAPEAGRYSIEELTFMLKILLMTSGRETALEERDDPEESIGSSCIK